jgi:hypothetical protein
MKSGYGGCLQVMPHLRKSPTSKHSCLLQPCNNGAFRKCPANTLNKPADCPICFPAVLIGILLWPQWAQSFR